MQKNKCYGKYIILGVFSLLILSCNILPMSNTLTKTEEEKSFSTQANINTPKLKTIPNFRFNEEDEAVEKKGTAYLSAGMIQNNPPVEELFVYNSADDDFYYNPRLYYFIEKREVKLSGDFKATFIEKTKFVDAGKIGRARHTAEVTIAGKISGTPDKLKLDFSSSKLYKSTSLVNVTGCDYEHTNVMYGGNFSGSSFLLRGNLYISGSLSGQGNCTAGGWCAWAPSNKKSISANFSMKSAIKEKTPVKVEVMPNKEKSRYYRTKGKGAEKVKIEVTSYKDDKWRLIIKGSDENGYARTYYLDGSGNQDIDWDGKTNDAINPQDDDFFESVTEIKLISQNRMESSAEIHIDNKPPDLRIVKDQNVKNVLLGVIVDLAGIDNESLPKEFADGDKTISIDYEEASNVSLNFHATVVNGFDVSETNYMKDLEYKLSGFLQDSIKDKLGNAYPTISVDGESTPVENTNPDNQMQVQALNIPYLVGELVARYAWKRFKNAHYGTGIYAPAEYRIGTGKPFVFRPVIGVGDYFQIRQGEYKVNANIRIVKEVNKKEYYGVNFLPYVGNVYSTTKYMANTGLIQLDKREWFGSIRNVNQKALSSSESILTSYKNHSDEINRIFAGPPFAINDVKDAGINHKIKLYLEYVRKPWSETNIRGKDYFEADLRIINEFQDYNKKFLNGKLYGQDDLPYKQSVTRNPYKIDDKKKLHIKVRHSMNVFNPAQFVKAYISKFADNSVHKNDILSLFTKREAKEVYKSSCYNVYDMGNYENQMFGKMQEIANMTDIYDKFKKDPIGLITVGTRDISSNKYKHIFNVLFQNDWELGSSFPDDQSERDLIITKENESKKNNPVIKVLENMTLNDIEDKFKKYMNDPVTTLKSTVQSLNSTNKLYCQKDGNKIKVDSGKDVYYYEKETPVETVSVYQDIRKNGGKLLKK